MIAYLKGKLVRAEENALILDVNGVGYQVFCTKPTLDQVSLHPDAIALEIETIYKQESIALYGFQSLQEKKCFTTLLLVPGVGAKVALAILSALKPEEFVLAIQHQDHPMLTRADGVGPKLAQRITRELNDRLSKLATLNIKVQTSAIGGDLIGDAGKALAGLGYRPGEVSQALKAIGVEHPEVSSLDTLITLALQKLSKSL